MAEETKPKENPIEDKLKTLLGDNANQELVSGIVALLGDQEQASQPRRLCQYREQR